MRGSAVLRICLSRMATFSHDTQPRPDEEKIVKEMHSLTAFFGLSVAKCFDSIKT